MKRLYIFRRVRSQAKRLKHAINEAEQAGWLGDQIQGGNFSFHVHVHLGAGAYICGEETALIESLEGKRGEPRTRPPYPPTAGYHGLPTLVNNVESYAAAPAIILNGASWYRTLSGATTPGTKMYMLMGLSRAWLFNFRVVQRQIEDFEEVRGSSIVSHHGGAAARLLNLLDILLLSGAKGCHSDSSILICDKTVPHLAFLNAHFLPLILRKMHSLSGGYISG
jgi:hypothetical protein